MQLFIGHLKLGDAVGVLLHTLINHTQLHVGSITPFFQLPYPSYAKWIDHTWVTSVWKFAHQAQLVLDVEDLWVPTLTCKKDAAIMDMAIKQNFSPQQLYMLNHCRLYLQVITISDVAMAKGTTILSTAYKGQKDPQCNSPLHWPTMPQPPQSYWTLWASYLGTLCNGISLQIP